MTGKDKDPFERLSQIAPPDPDPQRLAAAVAMSSRAFSQGSARTSPPRAKASWFANWFRGAGWAVPASAGAFALVALLMVPLAGRLDAPAPVPADRMAARERMVEAERPLSPAPEAEEGVRLGAAPASRRAEPPLGQHDDVTTETYEFNDIDLVIRSTPEEARLYLVEGDTERPIDRRIKEPSETVIVSDAFFHDRDDGAPALLLVRSGFDDGAQQWDAFVERETGYALSGATSLEIHDAADRAEVVARLEADTERQP